jgi:hypothetical protein
MNTDKRTFTGICHFFSEQGMEGGVWALQDERFIIPNTTDFRCEKCFKHWDKSKNPDGPLEGDTQVWTCSLDESGNFKGVNSLTVTPCADNMHDFRPSPPAWWHYAGLHTLESGDYMEIFDANDPNIVTWKGTINLVPTRTLYTERANQLGVDKDQWAKWFVNDKTRGRLTKKKLFGTCRFIGTPAQEWAVRAHGREWLLRESAFSLTIFDKKVRNKKIWNGIVCGPSIAYRFWHYADSTEVPRIEWARWFFREYPAEIEFLD